MLKWCLGSLILRRNIWQEAAGEIFLRAGVEEHATWHTRLEAVAVNWKHYSYKIYMLLLMGWLAFFILKSVRRGWRRDERYPALLLAGVSPIVWYMVLADHTNIHHLFTYRIFNAGILAVLCGLFVSLGKKNETGGGKLLKNTLWHRGAGKRAAAWGLVIALAALPALFYGEEAYVINSEGDYLEALMPEGMVFEGEFFPRYSHVTEMRVNIRTKSTEGVCNIWLRDADGRVLDKRSLPLDKVREQPFYAVDTDWRVKPGEAYRLQMAVSGSNEETYLIMLKSEESSFQEFGDMIQAGGQDVEGKPLAAFSYRVRKVPQGKDLLFAWLTWAAVGAALLPAAEFGIFCVAKQMKKS